MSVLRAGLVTLTALLVSACLATGNNEPRVKSSPVEAARYNTQLGVAYMQKGDLKVARDKLQRAVEQDPKSGLAHTYLALVYEQLGEGDRAGRHYKEAVRVAGADPDVRNLYGSYLCRNNELAAGEKQFVAAAKNPEYRTPEAAFTNAGVCVLGVPDAARAEQYFRLALDSNPRYADALQRMVIISHENGNNLAARGFLQRLEAVSTLSAQSLWLGSRVEHELGDRQAETGYLRQLIERYPESEEAGMAGRMTRHGESG